MAEEKNSEEFPPAVRKKLLAAAAKIHKQLAAGASRTKKAASATSKARKAFDEIEDEAP